MRKYLGWIFAAIAMIAFIWFGNYSLDYAIDGYKKSDVEKHGRLIDKSISESNDRAHVHAVIKQRGVMLITELYGDWK